MEEYTRTAVDFLGGEIDPLKKPLNIIQVVKRYRLGAKLVFCYKNNCWSIERSVKGKDIDGWFVPNPGQSVKYKINVRENNGRGTKL
mgnify:CR=1 FL=1